MPIVHKSINDASTAEIREYAMRFLNLDLDGNETEAQLLGLIKKQQTHENIFVETADAPEAVQDEADAPNLEQVELPTAQRAKSSGSLGREDPRVTIRIPADFRTEGSTNTDVFVAVNGVAWQLKRDMDLDVPYRVVEALENAVEHSIRHDEDGEVIENYVPRFQLNFPKGRPSQDVIDKWHAETDSLELA